VAAISLKKKYPGVIYDLALQNNFRRKILERTKAFKRFHAETGEGVGAFLGTSEGEMVAETIDYPTVKQRDISVDPRLKQDRYLEIRLDLTRSKERLRAEFEAILNENHDRVKRPPVLRGKAKLDLDKIDFLCSIYDLVERHNGSLLRATWEYYPETKNTQTYEDEVTDKYYQQIKRWHEKIKSIIGDL
jgi:hypothetical protein